MQFFVAIQKFLGVYRNTAEVEGKRANSSVVTFLEMNVLLWTSYLLLLFAYDDRLLGDRHPITVFIAFASLVWSAWLFLRLLKIQQIGYAIRYAIPVVIIFWTFVEILGRWNLFKEIWVHPGEYKIEMLIMLSVFILFGIILFTTNKWKAKKNKIVV
ncbi:MAG: hypothetical protein LIO65_05270 [Odoribacter sp.]|nr:hypothetical protein [Odoribacter sp.]